MSDKELIIYGKTDCSQCIELKHTLDSKGLDYTYLILDEDFSRDDLVKIKPANVRTFPVSFIKENDKLTYIKNADISINTLE